MTTIVKVVNSTPNDTVTVAIAVEMSTMRLLDPTACNVVYGNVSQR